MIARIGRIRLALVCVLIAPILDGYKAVSVRIVSAAENCHVATINPIAITEISPHIETQMLHLLFFLNRQSDMGRLINRSRPCYISPIPERFSRSNNGSFEDGAVTGIVRQSDRFIEGRQRRFAPHDVLDAVVANRSGSDIAFDYSRITSTTIFNHEHYFYPGEMRRRNDRIGFEQFFIRRLYQSQMAKNKAWTMIRDIRRAQKPCLNNGYASEYESQNRQKVVEPASGDIAVNVQLRDRRNDPYGLGFACCYVAGICLGSFSLDWRGIGAGIGFLVIGALTMMFNALPWTWPCWAWLWTWACGA